MSWLSELLANLGADDDRKTFDQDLEILIARWTDRSRKRENALTIDEVGTRLLDRAERILDRPKHKPKDHKK